MPHSAYGWVMRRIALSLAFVLAIAAPVSAQVAAGTIGEAVRALESREVSSGAGCFPASS